ncbi:MAG: YjfB family protein [Oscillospiraceae bacterium]|nr:YjfB family protein [Oscillospiraceae bacterium]
MQLQESIAKLAIDMKRFDFDVRLQTTMTRKAMDITKTLSQGVISMMSETPMYPGSLGGALDVKG